MIVRYMYYFTADGIRHWCPEPRIFTHFKATPTLNAVLFRERCRVFLACRRHILGVALALPSRPELDRKLHALAYPDGLVSALYFVLRLWGAATSFFISHH